MDKSELSHARHHWPLISDKGQPTALLVMRVFYYTLFWRGWVAREAVVFDEAVQRNEFLTGIGY